jgi:large subunit ribosomal protein L4
MVSDDVVFTRDALDAFVTGPVRTATAVASESEGSTL